MAPSYDEMYYYESTSSDISKIRVTVQDVKVNGVTGVAADYVYLEAGVKVDRYYVLNDGVQLNPGHNLISYSSTGAETSTTGGVTSASNHDVELYWEFLEGAEYYELEWCWVDNYDQTAGDIDLSDWDFRHHSTRVRVSNNHYRLPLVYAKGYLVYRVRGVGVFGVGNEDKLRYGAWSYEGNASDKVSNWPDYVEIGYAHEGDDMNWNYQATYAEEGKKKEVVSYHDGTLRGRQTVTRLNSDKHAVIGEQIYDNEGRQALQILPVP
ncbi:MAG: hypothetical protein GWN00_06930, partial [Aliifodinibius sp.]|nr:hypothetical protein [Fodinibius sp.]NIW44104.1 hypothetical protein [Gammaproteobacteria bacterium]NIY24552.1 hypothetical protein [Fodinibius sp.]